MNARNRVFLILGILFAGSLVWYLLTTHRSSDLELIGTVDANEVLVSSKIPGRIQTLTVDEGDTVKAGQLIAVIENEDLQAAQQAAAATAKSQQFKVGETVETEHQTRGETGSATLNAEAQLSAAKATLAQAEANYDHQKADTSRTVALTQQQIMSEQAKDDAVTTLQADKAAVDAARDTVAAAEASLHQARSHELLTNVAARTVDETRDQAANARALAQEAEVELGYSKVVAPVDGKVNVRAARQGEVVNIGAPIVTIVDLSDTWARVAIPETYADHIGYGDVLRVRLPGGTVMSGKVFFKGVEGDFATQRDVSRRKRDIKTIVLKVRMENPKGAFVPGMTAEVLISPEQLKSGNTESAAAAEQQQR